MYALRCAQRVANVAMQDLTSVAVGIMRAVGVDETRWFMRGWLHISYCPFCGTFVMGEGFGTYHKDRKAP